MTTYSHLPLRIARTPLYLRVYGHMLNHLPLLWRIASALRRRRIDAQLARAYDVTTNMQARAVRRMRWERENWSECDGPFQPSAQCVQQIARWSDTDFLFEELGDDHDETLSDGTFYNPYNDEYYFTPSDTPDDTPIRTDFIIEGDNTDDYDNWAPAN